MDVPPPRHPRPPRRTRPAGLDRDDPEGFEQLARDLSAVLAEQARRVLVQPSRAEDAVQEALLQMWLHGDRFDPERGTVRAWASTIAHHVAVDAARRERAAMLRDTLYAAGAGLVPYDEVVEAVEHVLDGERVRALAASLPGAQREAVDLVYFRGLEIAEVASLLEVPVRTVHSRLRAARASLRRMLGDQ